MKFEKFLKSVGTHGEVIARNEFDRWLICGGVGMKIPKGVGTLLGVKWDNDYASIVDIISKVELDDPVSLSRAVLLEADGKASDIYRVFASNFDEEVAISNADYGLLEKKDALGYFDIVIDVDENGEELPEDKVKTIKYLLVFDNDGDAIGFITGSAKF